MHEMGIMSSVLDLVVDLSKKNNVEKVLAIKLQIGEYSGIIPRLAVQFFEYLARDTVAEGAEVKIERVPLQVRCRDCGAVFHAEQKVLDAGCPECGAKDYEFLSSGRGWKLESIEVE